MNGIEALYKAMQDPTLEAKSVNADTFYTYREISNGMRIGSISTGELMQSWDIRKRQSNLDKAVQEIIGGPPGDTTTQALWARRILSKYIKD